MTRRPITLTLGSDAEQPTPDTRTVETLGYYDRPTHVVLRQGRRLYLHWPLDLIGDRWTVAYVPITRRQYRRLRRITGPAMDIYASTLLFTRDGLWAPGLVAAVATDEDGLVDLDPRLPSPSQYLDALAEEET